LSFRGDKKNILLLFIPTDTEGGSCDAIFKHIGTENT